MAFKKLLADLLHSAGMNEFPTVQDKHSPQRRSCQRSSTLSPNSSDVCAV